jgi:hypothetical protein
MKQFVNHPYSNFHLFCYFQGLEKDKLAYEKVPAINEKISRIQSAPISINNAIVLAQLQQEKEDLLKNTINASKSFKNQEVQRELQKKAANDGLDRLLQHSEIESLVDECDLEALMDPFGTCVSYIYACDANRHEEEATCFLTNRGYGNAIINFRPSDLDKQWKRRILYKGNNAINVNAVEKSFQKRYQHLPQGTRRLWKRAGAGGVGNKRSKIIPYPYIVGIFYREEGLQTGMHLN